MILPTYNEADNIEYMIIELLKHDNLDVIVVDDSSPDSTAQKVSDLAAKFEGRLHLISRAKRTGLRQAYIAGYEFALEKRFDVIAQMDADQSHDPGKIEFLLDPVCKSKADLVVGSRYIKGGSIPSWSWHRRFLSKAGNNYARITLSLPIDDATSGFRVYERELLIKLLETNLRAQGYGFQIEMAYNAHKLKARTLEVPIAFSERNKGNSKMGAKIIVEALVLVTFWGIRDRIHRT